MSVLDKIAKLKERAPKRNNSRMSGIFHDYEDGDNILRLVGNFVEVSTHFIAPVPKRKERGLCQEDAFQGDNKIPKVINCLDWDLEKEEKRKVKVCPICKLNKISYKIMDEIEEEVGGKDKLDDIDNAELKKQYDNYKALASLARARTYLKWNVIDRDNPEIKITSEDGKEEKKLGLKIATVGSEAWGDIEGIFDQCGIDITDPDDGIDICVKKGHNGARVAYSAQAVIEGTGLKTTPFTAEERALEEHNILAICGKQTDAGLVLDGLHGDYRELLDLNDEGAEVAEVAEVAAKEEPKVETKVETKVEATPKKAVAEKSKEVSVDDVEEDDEFDDFLDGDDEKKN